MVCEGTTQVGTGGYRRVREGARGYKRVQEGAGRYGWVQEGPKSDEC